MNLRKANQKDATILYQWATDPTVRENAIHAGSFSFESHVDWLNAKLSSQDTYLYIYELQDQPIGQVRFDRVNGALEIDYSISPNFRGQGFGRKIIEQGIWKLVNDFDEEVTFRAIVKDTNKPSVKIFERLGFLLERDDGNLFFYQLHWKKQTNIVLTNKIWNSSLVPSLRRSFNGFNWVHISDPKDFDLDTVSAINPVQILIPHWSHIIPKDLFKKYPCIVFHMTDLPFGRGGSPLQNLIVRGEKKTKISALRVVGELDAGPVYLKKELSLEGTAEEIFLRANKAIATMIEQLLKEPIKPREQEGDVVKFKRRTPEMSNIEAIEDLEKLYDQIRMMDAEGYPRAYLETQKFKFEFSRASLKADESILADVRIIKK